MQASCAIFDIAWQKLRYNGKMIAKEGLCGYRIRRTKAHAHKQAAIWQYGADLEWLYEGKSLRLWLCKICHTTAQYHCGIYPSVGGTNVKHHLRIKHRIEWDENGQLVIALAPKNTQKSLDFGITTTRTTIQVTPFNNIEFSQVIVDLAIEQDFTFRQASSLALRKAISYGRSELISSMISTPTTFSKYIKESYFRRRKEIVSLLQSSVSDYHLSCDVWTSTNGLSLLAVVVHFLGMK
jgi:hypothetical protein